MVGGASAAPASRSSERVAGRRAGRPAATAAPRRVPARHCWVADAADGRGVKRPGLLVEWRDVDGRWQGRVVYVGLLRSGRLGAGRGVAAGGAAHAVLRRCNGPEIG